MSTEWMERASCSEIGDLDLFFAVNQGRTYDSAKAVCGRCPVRVKCLAYALELESAVDASCGTYGVWGGLNPRERQQLRMGIVGRKPKRRREHGTDAAYRNHSRDGTEPCEPCRAAAKRTRLDRALARYAATADGVSA